MISVSTTCQQDTGCIPLERKQFYVGRLREEGCEVEWPRTECAGTMPRVTVPYTLSSDSQRDRVFRLIACLAEADYD